VQHSFCFEGLSLLVLLCAGSSFGLKKVQFVCDAVCGQHSSAQLTRLAGVCARLLSKSGSG
jgi:hypothetical protein